MVGVYGGEGQQLLMPKLQFDPLKLDMHIGIDKAYEVRVQATEFNVDTILEHINSTYKGKQKALLMLLFIISMEKQQCVTSTATKTAVTATAPTSTHAAASAATRISKLLKCLAEFDSLIANLLAALISLIELNRCVIAVAVAVAAATAAAIITASNSNKRNNNCNYGKSKKFKHFLSHRQICSNFKLTCNGRRSGLLLLNDLLNLNLDVDDKTSYLLVGRHDIVPFVVGTQSDALVAAPIFISNIGQAVVRIALVAISFIILQLLFCVCLLRIRLLAEVWRIWCVLRLTAAKAKMLRALQKFCKANCVSAKLNAYKKRDKRQDISSFSHYLFVPEPMKRSIVVRMVQMLVKHDKKPASCSTQSSPNVALDGSSSSSSSGGGGSRTDGIVNATTTNEANGNVSSNAAGDPSCSAEAHPSASTCANILLANSEMGSILLATPAGDDDANAGTPPATRIIERKTAPPLNKKHKSLMQTTNFVRVVKTPSQPVVQNVLRTVTPKATANVVCSGGSATDASSMTKQIGQNLFIYNAEGKIIRLTPLMGSNNNCYTTSAVEAMPVTTVASDVNDTSKKYLSLAPNGDDRKNYVAVKLPAASESAMVSCVSPPPLASSAMQFNAFVVANANAASTKALLPNTRSIYEETYAKFLKSKESTVSIRGESKTMIQCHPLLKSGTVIANAAKSSIVSGSGPGAANGVLNVSKQPLVGLSSIILKQLPKAVRPTQSFTFTKERVATTGDTTDVQLIESVSSVDSAATDLESSSSTNQFRITFPLISSTGRGDNLRTALHSGTVSMPSQQVIVTGASHAASSQTRRIQSIERAKLIAKKSSSDGRNVDHFTLEQLREFDMVLEQVKERSTTTTATTMSTATSVVPTVAAPDILTASGSNGFGHQRRVSLIGGNGQSISTAAGLLQKINLAILKKSTSEATFVKGNTKPSNSQPIVVVATANCSPSNVNNVIISPAAVSNIIQQTPPIGDSSIVTVNNNSEENKNRTKSIIEYSSPKSSQQQQLLQQKACVSTASVPSAKPSNKSQEDEQTVQRIYDILAQYAEQISSSPDLNNKPAPRRRSNLVSSISQTSTTGSKSKTSSTITTACLSSGNSSESSSQGTPSSGQTHTRKRIKSASVSASTESVDFADNADEIDAGPEKRHRPISSASKSTVESRDYIITSAYQTQSNSSSTSSVTNAFKSTGAAMANRFVLSNGVTEPLTIGIPTTGIDGNSNVNDVVTLPNQTVNVLISGNYLLPMGMIKSNRIGGSETVICSTTPTNKGTNVGQMLRPNLATLMFSRNATTYHADASKATKTPILNNQKFQFQTIQMAQPKCGSGKPLTTMPGAGATTYPSTILLPTISAHVAEAKTSTGPISKFHVGDATSAKFSPQIFQSNRGIIILNKKSATAISSSPTATAVAVTSATLAAPTTTTLAATPPVENAPTKSNSHETDNFLLPLDQTTGPSSEDETSQGMPLSFADESDPIFEEVGHQEMLSDQSHKYHDQLYHNDHEHEQVVIIDKKKSDALTLNSASHRRHADLHIKTRNDIERQLRLQKSLSEECEDLGVDEPSTSELFPEAELSFDNNSPIAFDVLSSHGTPSAIIGRSAFDFSNHRMPSTMKMKKVHKRSFAQEPPDSDASKRKTTNFNEMPSIGLNHTAYKDLSDSDDSPMDEFDGTVNAYSIKNAIIMDKMDKSTGNSTRIYREIRAPSKLISKSNRPRKYGPSAKICDKVTPFSLENGNSASTNAPTTATATSKTSKKNSALDHSRSSNDKYTPCLG